VDSSFWRLNPAVAAAYAEATLLSFGGSSHDLDRYHVGSEYSMPAVCTLCLGGLP
jgi:hypothetical protein